ncbi:MAG: hypothetical protein OEM61_14295 [Desulfobacteraceae bacterium]|nr:hypothetical protein [Desulfobacteraceae bacterium]
MIRRLGGRLQAGASLPGNNHGDPLGDVPHGTDMEKILQFDRNPELLFRSIHDDGEAAGADGEIPPEIHIGLDLVPVESGSIHDDSNKTLHKILVLRRLTEGR